MLMCMRGKKVKSESSARIKGLCMQHYVMYFYLYNVWCGKLIYAFQINSIISI